MRSYVFLTFGLALVVVNLGCNDAAKPPILVKSSPTPASTASSTAHDHSEDKNAPRISLGDAKKEYDAGTAVIVDVREPGAYRFERIKGSINIPQASLSTSLDKIPKGKKLIAYCSWRDEHTSASWVAEIKKKGFDNAYALLGGTQAWKDAGYPMEKN